MANLNPSTTNASTGQPVTIPVTGDLIQLASGVNIGTPTGSGDWTLFRNGTAALELGSGSTLDGYTARVQVTDSVIATEAVIGGGVVLSSSNDASRMELVDGALNSVTAVDWNLQRAESTELTVKSGEIEISGLLDVQGSGQSTIAGDLSLGGEISVEGAGISMFSGDIDTEGEVTADNGFAVGGTTVINGSREISNITKATIDDIVIDGTVVATDTASEPRINFEATRLKLDCANGSTSNTDRDITFFRDTNVGSGTATIVICGADGTSASQASIDAASGDFITAGKFQSDGDIEDSCLDLFSYVTASTQPAVTSQWQYVNVNPLVGNVAYWNLEANRAGCVLDSLSFNITPVSTGGGSGTLEVNIYEVNSAGSTTTKLTGTRATTDADGNFTFTPTLTNFTLIAGRRYLIRVYNNAAAGTYDLRVFGIYAGWSRLIN